jgi:hypothetical protein
MAKVIVENCWQISIEEVGHQIGVVVWQNLNDNPGLPQYETWGLDRFFSLEKPEWQDADDWAEQTSVNVDFNLSIRGNPNTTKSLKVYASPADKRLIFTYDVFNQYRREWMEKQHPVRLTAVPYNKKGFLRYFFVCPRCGCRVSKLYLPPQVDSFGCRYCYNLSYASRNVSRPGRPQPNYYRFYKSISEILPNRQSIEQDF